MEALLINPYVPLEIIYGKSLARVGAVLPSLGILYLTSYLKTKNKHSITVLDANVLKMGPAEVANFILRKDFACVGFSVTTLAYPYAVEIAKVIRQGRPGIKILLGGAHAQANYKNILKENPGLFDFVCYGEGEYAFESLLDYLDGNLPEDKIVGWSYLKDAKIFTTEPASIPEDLDVFGHPAEVVPAEYIKAYREKIFAYKRLPIFSIVSSRGCPFRCTFCSTPRKFDSLYEKKIRYHSIAWICQEMKILKERHGVREIAFADDTFNLTKERVCEFCSAVIKNNIRLAWTCNFEANIVDIAVMKMMKKAGCWGIMIGAESGSDKMLKFIKKGFTAGQLMKVGGMADRAGIVSRASFIIGMPTDTKETIEETIDFVKKCPFHFPYFQLYMPLPGTEMFGSLARYGEIVQGDPQAKSASRVNYIPYGLTEEYLLNAFKMAHKNAYLRWAMVGKHLKLIRSFADVARYWKGLVLLPGM